MVLQRMTRCFLEVGLPDLARRARRGSCVARSTEHRGEFAHLELAGGGTSPHRSSMNFRVLIVAFFALAFAGCESISDTASGVRERLAARSAPKVKTFSSELRPTYDAVRAAAIQMGYTFQRGGPAQGEFDAISGVGAGERLGTARQLAMKVRLRHPLSGGTEVAIRITEILEADSSNRAGQATESPLADTPQYEVFFERVSGLLGVSSPRSSTR